MGWSSQAHYAPSLWQTGSREAVRGRTKIKEELKTKTRTRLQHLYNLPLSYTWALAQFSLYSFPNALFPIVLQTAALKLLSEISVNHSKTEPKQNRKFLWRSEHFSSIMKLNTGEREDKLRLVRSQLLDILNYLNIHVWARWERWWAKFWFGVYGNIQSENTQASIVLNWNSDPFLFGNKVTVLMFS